MKFRYFLIFFACLWAAPDISARKVQRAKKVKTKHCGLPMSDPVRHRAYFHKRTSWKAGQTIPVYFLNGSEKQRGFVEHYAREWERYGNFRFEFHKEKKKRREETILIRFEQQEPGIGGWSNIGAGTESTTEPSMSYNNELDGLTGPLVLHEFGHALGLEHEQNSPGGALEWNREEAYKYFKDHMGWDKKATDENIFNRTISDHHNWTTFDPQSIMAYELPGHLFKTGQGLGGARHLSTLDKQGIATMYPGKSKPADSPFVELYLENKGNIADIRLESAALQIYVNGQLAREMTAPAGEQDAVNVNIDSFLNPSQTNQITIKVTPMAAQYSGVAMLDRIYLSCDSNRPCSGSGYARSSAYLTHFSNRNQGQANAQPATAPPAPTPAPTAAQPEPIAEDEYADLKGKIKLNKALNGELIVALAHRRAGEVRNLLRNGASPDATREGWTALMFAAYLDDLEIMKMLLARGAKLEKKAHGYWTAYKVAKKYKRVAAMDFLKRAGAKTGQSNVHMRGLSMPES